MSDSVIFKSISHNPDAARVDNDRRTADLQFRQALTHTDDMDSRSGSAGVYQAGYEDGVAAALSSLKGGSPSFINGMPDRYPVAGYPSGMNYPETGSVGLDLYAMDPSGMSSHEVGSPSSIVSHGSLSGTDPLTGAMNWIKQMTQLLTMIAQLDQMAGQIGRGQQYSDMSSSGSGMYPGAFQHLDPEMSIMPVGNHLENIRDRGSFSMASGPDGDDLRAGSESNGTLNLSPEVRELNRRISSGNGEIALDTETAPDAGALREAYSGGPLDEVVRTAMRDPAELREQVFALLSGLGAPENVTAAFNELFDLLDAGDEQAFINAYLNLSRTNLDQFLVPLALEVANSVQNDEMVNDESNPAIDKRDIADTLPINLAEDVDDDDAVADEPVETVAA